VLSVSIVASLTLGLYLQKPSILHSGEQTMKVRQLFAQVLAVVFTALLAISSVQAQSNSSPTLKRIAETETLRVGMTGAQAPFNMKNRAGTMIGMDVDLARALALSMRVKLEIVEMPFAELLPALESGKIDLVISGMTATLKRNTRVPFVGPYYVTGASLLTTSDKLAAAKSTGEINNENVSVAVLAGSTSEEFARALLAKAKIVPTKDHAAAVAMLLDGKVDAVVADAPTCALSALRNPEAGLVVSDPFTIEPIGIAVAPGDPLLVNLVGNYTDALAATGAMEALIGKWFGNGAWLAQMQ
jgi:polar amino acid transport system substrate-binding protein